jgi:hypothetical protein
MGCNASSIKSSKILFASIMWTVASYFLFIIGVKMSQIMLCQLHIGGYGGEFLTAPFKMTCRAIHCDLCLSELSFQQRLVELSYFLR